MHVRVKTALLFLLAVQQGYDAQIIRVSSNPIKAFEGSNAVFHWTLGDDVTSRPDFEGLVFGVWKNGYLATYLTTVTRTKHIISNPGLKVEAPHLNGRVQWKGDLSKSVVAFQISHVSAQDQMDYGVVLNFGPYRNSPSDSVRLEVNEKSSFIKALPSLPISVSPGDNATFRCEFHVSKQDKSNYDGVTVGVWERGGILLTLVTVTSNEDIIVNPKLREEGSEYVQRIHAHLSTNYTNNDVSVVAVVLTDVKESFERFYGCSMHFGPFEEPIGSPISLEVQDFNNDGPVLESNSSQQSLEVRVGDNIVIHCPVLAEVIKQDGTFKALYWSYCVSKVCTTKETKWVWLAGMNSSRATEVTHKGRYTNRVNLSGNGTLEVNSVQVADATDYRCTVQRINYTSPRVYFVILSVNASVPPRIVKRSKDKVTVVKGNVLYLFCKVDGNPKPLVTWRKNGKVLQRCINETDFIVHEAGEKDSGRYECEASNTVGTVSYTVEVTVQDDKDHKKLTTTGIVLVALGVGLLVVFIVVGISCKLCKRSKQREFYVEV